MLAACLLTVLAVVLAGPAPRLMSRWRIFRRTPGPALVAWQSVSTAAVLSSLLIAPAAVLGLTHAGSDRWSERIGEHPAALGLASAITALMAGSLLLSGHRVGRRVRTLRRRHRDLVDLLAAPGLSARSHTGPRGTSTHLRDTWIRVLDHPGVSAYCVPGLRRRVVVSRGAIDLLTAPELEAVLAHERAHLTSRHDLVLEFFTVVHGSVPVPVRSTAALQEVHLLVEALADRSAIRSVGPVPLARALVRLGSATTPDAALGAGGNRADLRARIDLIAAHDRPTRALTAAAFTLSLAVLLTPVAVFTLAW